MIHFAVVSKVGARGSRRVGVVAHDPLLRECLIATSDNLLLSVLKIKLTTPTAIDVEQKKGIGTIRSMMNMSHETFVEFQSFRLPPPFKTYAIGHKDGGIMQIASSSYKEFVEDSEQPIFLTVLDRFSESILAQ